MQHASNLYEHVKRFVRANSLFERGQTVLAAVSGGIDSVVLLDLMAALADEWKLDLRILHINHWLRGAESDADEKFVRSLASRYGLPISVSQVRTTKEAAEKKISIQEAARDLRYSFFLKKKSEFHADAVATAHNANDNAETMLMNFFRGTGIDGIAGIPTRRDDGTIVRPLLFASRSEIARYAKQEKLAFREDSSNASDKYSRNYLRRNVIPLLEKNVNPALMQTLSQSSQVFKSCAEYLGKQVAKAAEGNVSEKKGELVLQVDGLTNEHPYIQQMVVHDVLLGKNIEPSFDRIAGVVSLLDARKGTRVDCGSGWIAEKGSDHVLIVHGSGPAPFLYVLNGEGTLKNESFSLRVQKCGSIPNKLTGHTSTEEYVDARKVQFPLRVRSWKEGDTFVPLGMKSKKKVSDLFVDLKISRVKKNIIPIVESNGAIVWIAGCRLDDRCKITASTTEAYKLSINSV